MRAAIHMPVAARASLAPLAPPTRRAALAPLPKTARTLKPSLIAVAPHRLGAAAPIVVARAAPANASTAKIIVTGRHVELTAPLKEYAEDKVAKAVHNYESVVKEIDVRLSVAGGDAGKGPRAQRAEVTIFTHRYGVVRVEDCEESAYAAVDVVCDKVRSKLRRVKEKAIARGRWPGSARPRGAEKAADAAAEAAAAGASSDSDSDELAGISSAAAAAYAGAYAGAAAAPEELIREKTFSLTPMTAAEAAEQLDLLGHDFYVFADSAGGGVRVVYKRREKGYGVIVPRLPVR